MAILNLRAHKVKNDLTVPSKSPSKAAIKKKFLASGSGLKGALLKKKLV